MVFGAILEITIRVYCGELPKFKIPGFVGDTWACTSICRQLKCT